MSEADNFNVHVSGDGTDIRIRGKAACWVLLRLALTAKFAHEAVADILLSPHVNHLVDELYAALPNRHDVDWSDPSVRIPYQFMAVAEEVARFRDTHQPETNIETLLATAFKPYAVPSSRVRTSAQAGSVTFAALDRLDEIERHATPGPWFVRKLDDNLSMNSVVVSTCPDTGSCESMRVGQWPKGEVVAATLLQEQDYVIPADNRYDENAELIALTRSLLVDLVRLARAGLAARDEACDPMSA